MTRRMALTVLTAAVIPAQAGPARVSCRQLLRVETPSWPSTSGTLTLWTRDKSSDPWQQDGTAISVMVGRSGLRWGRGLHAIPRGAAVKREGDGCSPAGIFRLDTAFGSMPAAQSGSVRWPWRQMTSTHAGVDDPASRFYNRVVDAAAVKKDWNSAEDMMPKSGVYRRGIIVQHNWNQTPSAGSCIFLHIRSRKPTAGCTAMSEKDLLRLLVWLDPARQPLLVQLPAAEWPGRGAAWGFPATVKSR